MPDMENLEAIRAKYRQHFATVRNQYLLATKQIGQPDEVVEPKKAKKSKKAKAEPVVEEAPEV